MMKPGIGSYDRFKQMFEKFSAEAGKKQYLIPYFIAAHPGTSDEDMMNLALWLKRNGFRADQVQTFYPSPMATATAMYHSGRNTLRKVRRDATPDDAVDIVRGEKRRRLHKAFLRYHDPNNWPLLREALKAMGRADLIGNGKHHLIPTFQPVTDGSYVSARRKNSTPVAGGGRQGRAGEAGPRQAADAAHRPAAARDGRQGGAAQTALSGAWPAGQFGTAGLDSRTPAWPSASCTRCSLVPGRTALWEGPRAAVELADLSPRRAQCRRNVQLRPHIG